MGREVWGVPRKVFDQITIAKIPHVRIFPDPLSCKPIVAHLQYSGRRI